MGGRQLQKRADKRLYQEQHKCDTRRKELKAKLERVWMMLEASPREYLSLRSKVPEMDKEPPAKQQKRSR